MQPYYVEAHSPLTSAKVSFVRIDPADWKLPGDNQRVSNSELKVTLIAYIVIFKFIVNLSKKVKFSSENKKMCPMTVYHWYLC